MQGARARASERTWHGASVCLHVIQAKNMTTDKDRSLQKCVGDLLLLYKICLAGDFPRVGARKGIPILAKFG